MTTDRAANLAIAYLAGCIVFTHAVRGICWFLDRKALRDNILGERFDYESRTSR